jgi:hypothetical protein
MGGGREEGQRSGYYKQKTARSCPETFNTLNFPALLMSRFRGLSTQSQDGYLSHTMDLQLFMTLCFGHYTHAFEFYFSTFMIPCIIITGA